MIRYLFLALLILISGWCGQDRSGSARERMVQDQIIARGIKDTSAIRALRNVPRHEFVPPELTSFAYEDHPLPIGYDQTISQPYIVALMTELIKPEKGRKVLEVGTGSGYQAAVLAEIVDSVYTIEILNGLAETAAVRLKRLGYFNVAVRCGDGYAGWKEAAPFDGIIVTAAADSIPPPLIEQLKDGGIMVIPVGSVMSIQSLTVVRKLGKEIKMQTVLPVRFVQLIHSR
jgi:protein-L-isoaspartate(D-aspartate) O-methyltransferase